MIQNPIIQREFVGLLKTPKALYLQIAIAIGLALLVLIRYPSNAVVGIAAPSTQVSQNSGADKAGASAMSKSGAKSGARKDGDASAALKAGSESRTVFSIVSYGLMAAVLLMVPAFPATSIVREKISGTLALLLNSPMKPWSIYFGKFFGVLLFFLLLLALSLPALFACHTMGITLTDIGLMYLIAICASTLFIAIGLMISTMSGNADSALRYTYMAAFGVTFATLVPWFFLEGKKGYLAQFSGLLQQLSPLTAIRSLLGEGQVVSKGVMQVSEQPILSFILLSLVVSGILMVANIIVLSRRIFDVSRSAGKVTNEQSKGVQLVRRLFFVVDPNRRKSGIPPFVNPVFVQEFRTRRFGRSHWLMRIVSLLAVGSILLTYLCTSSTLEWGSEMIGSLMVIVQIAIAALVAPSLASGLISSEIESGGWNLLMLTPLRPYSILLGKLLSVFWTVFLLLAATLPGYVVLLWINPADSSGNLSTLPLETQVKNAIISLVLATVLIISLSAMISSFFKRAAVSTAVAYGATTVLFASTFLVWFGRETTFGYETVRWALLFNPIAGALESVQTSGLTDYRLVPLNWYITGVLSAVFFVVFFVRTSMLARPR